MIFYVVMITISDSAYKQISKLKESKAEPDQHLRLFVESGGCSGFEYGMSFDFIKEDDVKIEKEDLFIIIDPTSLSYLDGCREKGLRSIIQMQAARVVAGALLIKP